MSTLTKVFVVLLTVFSIAFTVMTVSITAQTTNWRDLAQKYENHAVVADTHLRNMIAANAAELASARDALSASLTKIKELEEANKKSSDEAAQLKLEQARAAAEKSNAEAMNRGLLAQLQVAEDGRSEYRKQRDDLETRNAEIETRNIDLNDRVNELTAQVTVLLEQRRQFEQQLALLKSENERLATSTQRVSSAMSLESPTGEGSSRRVGDLAGRYPGNPWTADRRTGRHGDSERRVGGRRAEGNAFRDLSGRSVRRRPDGEPGRAEPVRGAADSYEGRSQRGGCRGG